jgi:hypothetical protein
VNATCKLYTAYCDLHFYNTREDHWILQALWSSGQSSWLQIRRPGFDSRHYQKKSSGSGTRSTQPREYNWGATWKKSSGSCLENRENDRRDPSRWPRGTVYPQKLTITSPTGGGRSVGIVRSRTQTIEFSFSCFMVSRCRLCGLVVTVPGYGSRLKVRFPVLSDFLRTGCTQPHEYNWGATWKKK